MAIRIIEPAGSAAQTAKAGRVRVIEPASAPNTGYAKAKKRTADAYQLNALPEPIRKVATTAMDRGLTAAQGAGLGWVDEGLGLLAGAAQAGVNLFADTGISPTDAYRAQRDVIAGRLADRKKTAPVDSTALELGGGIVTLGGPAAAKFVAGAKSLPGVAARSAAVGAAYGGVAGAGSAKEGARASGAAKGAVTGAAIGGAIPVVARAAQNTGRAVNALSGYRLSGGVEASAAGRLREALLKDGVDEQQIAQLVKQYADTGAMPPALIDVAGENTRALIRFAGSRPGEARNVAQGYRDATVEGLPDAAINRAQQLTPNEARPAAVVQEGIEASRGATARVDYAPAYARPVPVDAQIMSALEGDAGRAALQRARQAASARRDANQVAEIDALIRGDAAEVSAGTLDRVRIAMNERGQTATRRGARDIAGGINSRAADIDQALAGVPEMAPARAAFRASSEAIDAVDVGQRLLKDSPDVFAASFNANNPQALEAAKVGARQALTDALGQRANAAPVLRQIALAPNARRNLTVLFGEAEANRFIEAAKLNLKKSERANFIAPNTNSQTASRQQDANLFKNTFDAVRKPLQAIMERVAAGLTITDAEAAELVRIGLMKPEQAMALTRPRIPAAAGNRGIGRASAATANALAQQ